MLRYVCTVVIAMTASTVSLAANPEATLLLKDGASTAEAKLYRSESDTNFIFRLQVSGDGEATMGAFLLLLGKDGELKVSTRATALAPSLSERNAERLAPLIEGSKEATYGYVLLVLAGKDLDSLDRAGTNWQKENGPKIRKALAKLKSDEQEKVEGAIVRRLK